MVRSNTIHNAVQMELRQLLSRCPSQGCIVEHFDFQKHKSDCHRQQPHMDMDQYQMEEVLD
jgi:hypothetical protein